MLILNFQDLEKVPHIIPCSSFNVVSDMTQLPYGDVKYLKSQMSSFLELKILLMKFKIGHLDQMLPYLFGLLPPFQKKIHLANPQQSTIFTHTNKSYPQFHPKLLLPTTYSLHSQPPKPGAVNPTLESQCFNSLFWFSRFGVSPGSAQRPMQSLESSQGQSLVRRRILILHSFWPWF